MIALIDFLDYKKFQFINKNKFIGWCPHQPKLKPKLLLFFIIIILNLPQKSFSQAVNAAYFFTDSSTISLPLKKNFYNNKSCEQYIEQLPAMLKAKGFVSASIDSVVQGNNTYSVYLFLGKKYTWKTLNISTEAEPYTQNVSLEKIPETILNYYQNNGYPFARIGFDSIHINNKNEITASLKMDKGIAYKLDSIRVFGNVNISNNFFSHYLNLQKNTLFNNNVLEKLDARLNQLSFLQTTKNSEVLMLNNGYVINVYVAAKKVNRFDVIFGLLPNNSQNNGKLLFTVDANIALINAFAKGETITFMWQQIQPESPRIDVGFAMPYIFKTNAQLDFKFNLYKRDSAFINIATNIGLTYDISEKSKFSIALNNLSSRIITADTTSIIATKKLPDFLDMNITNLGIEYYYNNTFGSTINRQKGFEIRLSTSFGQKVITANTTITSLKTGGFNYNSLYDSIKKNTYQVKAKVMAAKYFKLSKFSILKLQENAGVIQTSQVFQNEQFQIGGFKLLRGFDEENIFTNAYFVNSLEYRYLINNNSYFYLFSDLGFSGNSITNKNYSYISGGLGLALQTKQGVLNFCFASGKRNDLPFNFRESKIHIGLITGL